MADWKEQNPYSGYKKDGIRGAAQKTNSIAALMKRTDQGLQFQDTGERPGEVGYQGLFDDKGVMGSRFAMTPEQAEIARDLQSAGYGDFQKRLQEQALRDPSGLSRIGQLGMQQQRAGELGLQASLARQMAGQQAQQQAGLAARGGLSSGARSRLAAQQMQAGLLGRQNIAGQGATQRLGLTQQDLMDQTNLQRQLQSQFANLEEERLRSQIGREDQYELFNTGNRQQAQAMNVQNAVQDQMLRNQYMQDKYKTDMQEWANNKEIAAQEKLKATTGGLFGSGGMLGTGLKF